VLTEFTNECDDAERPQCIQLRENNDVESDLLGVYIGCLIALIVIFRTIALFVLGTPPVFLLSYRPAQRGCEGSRLT